MNRRNFLSMSLASASLPLLAHTKSPDYWEIIALVQETLLPKTPHMPSANEVNAASFLKEACKSKYFDSSDYAFIIKGVEHFVALFPRFTEHDMAKRTEILKEASKNDYFDSWLSLLIYYGLEAMLSDPIYGGNPNQIAWKALGHYHGEPRPHCTYAKKSCMDRS